HEQYTAPKYSAQMSRWIVPKPGAVSIENACPDTEPVTCRQSASSWLISDGQNSGRRPCRVSCETVNGPTVSCRNAPDPVSSQRRIAALSTAFTAAFCWSFSSSSSARQGATRTAWATASSIIASAFTGSIPGVNGSRSAAVRYAIPGHPFSSSVAVERGDDLAAGHPVRVDPALLGVRGPRFDARAFAPLRGAPG